MSANEYIIKDRAEYVQYDLGFCVRKLKDAVIFSETSADREFWETQADVLSDVVAAINERLKQKKGE
jgi:hypothetical protein